MEPEESSNRPKIIAKIKCCNPAETYISAKPVTIGPAAAPKSLQLSNLAKLFSTVSLPSNCLAMIVGPKVAIAPQKTNNTIAPNTTSSKATRIRPIIVNAADIKNMFTAPNLSPKLPKIGAANASPTWRNAKSAPPPITAFAKLVFSASIRVIETANRPSIAYP